MLLLLLGGATRFAGTGLELFPGFAADCVRALVVRRLTPGEL